MTAKSGGGWIAMDLDYSSVFDSWRFLLGGLGLTLALSFLTMLCSLVLGGAIGLARCYGPQWLRVPLVFYIDSMRSVPVLVVLVWTYFALPLITGVTLPPFWAALVALTAQIAAYVAEIVRAGVTSIRAGQTRAAFALGMSRAQTIRTIILPQATGTHAAGIRLDPVDHHQGHRHRRRDRGARIYEPVADRCRTRLPPDRGFHCRYGGLLRRFVSGHPHRGHGLCAPCPSRPIMNFDWSVVSRNAGVLLEGTELTILLAVTTMVIAIPGGILLALMRLSGVRAFSAASASFVELFRNLPLILVIYTAYYILPVTTGLSFSPIATAIVALSLNVSAYNGETFRAGIASIRRGQTEAAYALGMTRWQTMRDIVLPQAVRRVLPVLASTWVSLFKDTSLVSVISVSELAYTSMRIRAQTYRVLEMLTAMAAIYWLLGYPQAKLVDWINRRYGMSE